MKIISNSFFKESSSPSLEEPFKIDIDVAIFAKKALRFLLIVVSILVFCSLLGDVIRSITPDFPLRDFLAYRFAVRNDHNFPTLYSSLALLFCAVLLGFISCLKHRVKDRYTIGWQILAFTFVYLSIDELIGLHEALSKPMHNLGVNGFFHNAWVVPGFIVLSVFLLCFYKFFRHLPRSTQYLTALSAFLAIGGAFGVELLNGYYKYLNGEENWGYILLSTLEEVMEMLGIVLFIYTLLIYLPKMGVKRIKWVLNVNRNN